MKVSESKISVSEVAEKFGISEKDVRKLISRMNICQGCQYEYKPWGKPCPICGNEVDI